MLIEFDILIFSLLGADLNVKNLLGQTPLMRAVLFDDAPIVKALLKAGKFSLSFNIT